MKKLLLFMAVALSFGQLSAQKNAWSKVSQESVSQAAKMRPTTYSERQQLFQVNLNAVKQALVNAADRFSGAAGVIVEFPNINGNLEKFQVWENSNFAPELQAQYPEIRAYVGKSLADNATINFSVSPEGLQSMILRTDRSSEFIEPYTKDSSVYVLFDSQTRTRGSLPFTCSTTDVALNRDLLNNDNVLRSNTQSFKTMRLALSCTGEYGAFFGGTVAGALAGMNATMTRVNGVMEIDLAIHLNIIANNNLVVYTNAATDPYSSAAALDNWNAELQANLTAVIGEANYDIGHLFGATGGGGNAGCIGCVCNDGKGSGYTSPYDGIPQGDTYDIDYVIHEMGHQLGATHTFSHNTEGSGTNVEPGSGSTIMGYAGITDYDVQAHSDAYYAYRSILQIQTNMAGKTCPVSTPITNTPPTVTAPADFTIPSGTAFILHGVVTDAEGDNLNYCWEQNNNAPASQSGANSVCSATKLTGPNYRSFNPKTTPDRYMPDYAKVLAGTLSTTWESVSTVARTSKYTLTVRDNHVGGPQTNTDEVLVTTAAPYNGTTGVGPFQITSEATAVAWVPGATETITWAVNNTTTLPGSANVNIKMSTDGGLTFPIILAANTPNDGSEPITVPSGLSQTCRLLIEPTANYYYAVSAVNFSLGYQLVTTCTTYNYSGAAFTLANPSTSYNVKTINVPTAGTISDVNVHFNVTANNDQNLNIALIAPGVSLFPLFNQQCAGSANMDVTFDSQGSVFDCGNLNGGTMALPVGTLNNLNGGPTNGNWQFGFRDLVAGETVTINSFWLEVCSSTLVPLGTKEFGFENFALYPNPNNGSFKVQFDSASGSKIGITVFDISGRKIFDKSYSNSGMFSQDLQLDHAQSGVYLVSITDGDQKIVKRIVVE